MLYRERGVWAAATLLSVVSLALALYADYRETAAQQAGFQERQVGALGSSARGLLDAVTLASQDLLLLSQQRAFRELEMGAARQSVETYFRVARDRSLVRVSLFDPNGRCLLRLSRRPLDDRPGASLDALDSNAVDWGRRPDSAGTVKIAPAPSAASPLGLVLTTPLHGESTGRQLGVLVADVDFEPAVHRTFSRQAFSPATQLLIASRDRILASEPPSLEGHALSELAPEHGRLSPQQSGEDHEVAAFMEWRDGARRDKSAVAWWPLRVGEERWLLMAVTPLRSAAPSRGSRLGFLLPWLVSTLALAGAAVLLVRSQRQKLDLVQKIAGEQERSRDAAELAWQNALVGQIVDEIRHSMDAASITRVAVESARRVLRVSQSAIYLPDGHGSFRVGAVSSAGEPLAAHTTLPPPLGSDTILSSPLSEEDLASHMDLDVRQRAADVSARACLLAPVPLGRGRNGVFAVYHDEPRTWKVREVQCIERIASQVGTALEQAELYAEQVRAAEVRAALLKVGPALSSARNRSAAVALAAMEAARLTNCHRTILLAREAQDGPLKVAAWSGGALPAGADLDRLQFDLSEHAFLAEAVRARRPLFIPDASRDPRVPAEEARSLGLQSVLVIPLLYGDRVLGVFLFDRAISDGDLSPSETEVAQAIAELTSAALMNAQLFEALRTSEARYQDLYDNAPDLYQTLDPRGLILDCNETERRLLGFEKDEIVGRPFESFLAPESKDACEKVLARVFDEGFVQDVPLKLSRKDGRFIEVSLNASVRRDPSRSGGAVRAVLRDVTQFKELERQLHQSQKLEGIGTLAGGVAHDFNNILGGILGYASLLRDELAESPRAQKFLETIERSAIRGAELTAKLLAASRRGPVRLEPVDLNQVVEETVEILERTLHKNIAIDKRLDWRLPPLSGDRSQLQQVVLNLCVNSRDAMPLGGRLRVETERLDSEGKVRISVEDTGVGMDATVIDRIFEPFFSTKGPGGSGLGLSVVYGIVKGSGGDVKVTSALGRGARFDVFLPAVWAEEKRVEAAEPRGLVEGAGQTVLLVDDEEMLRNLGREILVRSGYRVYLAASGLEAVDLFRSHQSEVSLVIVDLLMPQMDGAETFERLRSVDPEVPVLLSSGFSEDGTVQRLLSEGASDFLPKPYTLHDLTSAVARVLDRHSKRSALP